jgi:hypothetical protein
MSQSLFFSLFASPGLDNQFYRYHGSHLKGSHLWIVMEYAHVTGKPLHHLIAFFRFCSGGSCSDLVGLLVVQSLSIPESLCR